MHTKSTPNTSNAGFTLVELVVVIVIVGILGAVAMPRFFNDRTFAERGYFEEVVAAMRLAQKTAVATGCPVRVVVSANSYTANQQAMSSGRCDPSDASWSVPVRLADGEALAGSAPNGVNLSPASTWTFDALGRTSLGADLTVTVGVFTFTVRAASGYVDTP